MAPWCLSSAREHRYRAAAVNPRRRDLLLALAACGYAWPAVWDSAGIGALVLAVAMAVDISATTRALRGKLAASRDFPQIVTVARPREALDTNRRLIENSARFSAPGSRILYFSSLEVYRSFKPASAPIWRTATPMTTERRQCGNSCAPGFPSCREPSSGSAGTTRTRAPRMSP